MLYYKRKIQKHNNVPSTNILLGLIFTSGPFLKNGGRYCFGFRRRLRCPRRFRRLRRCFALYRGCY